MKQISGTVPPHWTLIRGARQVVTLQGTPGPRHGRRMSQVEVIQHGTVLLRGERVFAVGPSVRIENLAEAKNATEVNAAGKVIIPAFVETDATIFQGAPDPCSACNSHKLQVSSAKKLEGDGIRLLQDYVNHGTLVTGVAARPGTHARLLSKLLRVQRTLQTKVARIRSIATLTHGWGAISLKWFQMLRAMKAASILDINLLDSKSDVDWLGLRHLAALASNEGVGLRFRIAPELRPEALEFAAAAGAVGIVEKHPEALMKIFKYAPPNAILSFTIEQARETAEKAIRSLLDAGAALSFSAGGLRNMQSAIHQARANYGMSVEEALTAITWNAAYALRAGNSTGSIEPGKFGDFLLLDLSDYRELGLTAESCKITTLRGGHYLPPQPH